MLDPLLSPIDSARGQEVGPLILWHARAMVFAWGFALPLGVLIARFFKIWPGQDWPRELDHQTWWRSHLTLQYTGAAVTALGLALALSRPGVGADDFVARIHRALGWAIVAAAGLQVLGGWLRGAKGGPTAPAPDGSWRGDHYDMTLRRRVFELVHKSVGYAALALASAAIPSGLWLLNAPVWMWLTLAAWWALLVAAFVLLQRRGMAVDTYQAIWGPDPAHPGNEAAPLGWGVRRVSATGSGGSEPTAREE